MDKKGLKKLRKFINGIPDVAFSWEKYSFSGEGVDEDGDPIEEDKKETLKHMIDIAAGKAPSCNTVGCVAGWAAVCHPKRFGYSRENDLCYRRKGGRLDRQWVNEAAFARAYDLSGGQAERIVFGFERYPNNKQGALECLDHMINGDVDHVIEAL